MEYYKTIKFYLERNMIDLSEDQIKRRITKLKLNSYSSNIIKKKLIGKTYAWCVNYFELNHFQRIRKKVNRRKTNVLPINKSLVNKCVDYKYEVSINLKSGIQTKNLGESYSYDYYRELADSIFRIVRADMFYIIETDEFGYNHLHMGINSDEVTIKIAVDYVLKSIFCFEDEFLKKEKVSHTDEIRNLFAFYEYLDKDLNNLPVNYIYKNENYYE